MEKTQGVEVLALTMAIAAAENPSPPKPRDSEEIIADIEEGIAMVKFRINKCLDIIERVKRGY